MHVVCTGALACSGLCLFWWRTDQCGPSHCPCFVTKVASNPLCSSENTRTGTSRSVARGCKSHRRTHKVALPGSGSCAYCVLSAAGVGQASRWTHNGTTGSTFLLSPPPLQLRTTDIQLLTFEIRHGSSATHTDIGDGVAVCGELKGRAPFSPHLQLHLLLSGTAARARAHTHDS